MNPQTRLTFIIANNSCLASLCSAAQQQKQQTSTSTQTAAGRAAHPAVSLPLCLRALFVLLCCEAQDRRCIVRLSRRVLFFFFSKPKSTPVDCSKWSQLKSISNHAALQRLLSPERNGGWKQVWCAYFRLMVDILKRYVRARKFSLELLLCCFVSFVLYFIHPPLSFAFRLSFSLSPLEF